MVYKYGNNKKKRMAVIETYQQRSNNPNDLNQVRQPKQSDAADDIEVSMNRKKKKKRKAMGCMM
jgi:hypothetical protein